jgi:hypothetical protein
MTDRSDRDDARKKSNNCAGSTMKVRPHSALGSRSGAETPIDLAMSHQALACDWMHEANQGSTTVVCANGKCEAVRQQTAKQEPVEAAPAVPKVNVERADLAPITVADGCSGSNC